MDKPPFRLAPDYNAPYEPWAPSMLRKVEFLRDARRLLRQVARYLPPGFTFLRVATCAGGPAAGGEVYAYYAYAEGKAVCLCVGQAALTQAHRPDHIGCHAHTCRYRDPSGRCIGSRGLNVWLDPNLDARALAQAVVDTVQGQYRVTSMARSHDGGPELLFAYGVHQARQPQQLALW